MARAEVLAGENASVEYAVCEQPEIVVERCARLGELAFEGAEAEREVVLDRDGRRNAEARACGGEGADAEGRLVRETPRLGEGWGWGEG